MEIIKNFLVYVIAFALAMFTLSSLNFEKLIKKNKVVEAQLLYILLAMALGYLVANFIQRIIF